MEKGSIKSIERKTGFTQREKLIDHYTGIHRIRETYYVILDHLEHVKDQKDPCVAISIIVYVSVNDM